MSFLSVLKEVTIVAQRRAQNLWTERERIHDNIHTSLKDKQASVLRSLGRKRYNLQEALQASIIRASLYINPAILYVDYLLQI